MRSRLLLEEHRSKIGYTAGVTNTVANAISRLDMNPFCKIRKKILKGLDENDYIQNKQVHLSRVLSQSLQDNNNVGTSRGECFANMNKEV